MTDSPTGDINARPLMEGNPMHHRNYPVRHLISYADDTKNWLWPIGDDDILRVISNTEPSGTWRALLIDLNNTIELAQRIIKVAEQHIPEARPLVGQCIPLPQEFVTAFVAEAESRNEGDDPLDLTQFNDKTIGLSNDCPGFSPVLRILRDDQGRHTVVIGHNGNDDIPEAQASVDIDLSDPQTAALQAVNCWDSTL
ncbi:Uncharacterised protein [Mycobacteroides abscessus subsp. massiliense]|uniref:hypothetical protein n=1 Tax=Mycobacteroides abscessus TaxID=36809 RepID=UPI0009A694D4|nr:hypothetical protein [Mycobacteroides abscessus]SKF35025.1 Uncharacterised protein [Mycobacteroides abscessus subsp. massiliense]SKF44256.1 Uncharacterised protein [Mycobacteroides abscessus subsp. massiliense]SKF46072.1 Uncharacterised protein [Mycobacteroides abscessus subsp. massiliense]SKF49178.1 Uncharacterised protein [Mycobacteroides abscessus subsp. massiliense]SKF49344.1 Uncharacterised protein [Mycobacteroides abscessus subsp. massiliense]